VTVSIFAVFGRILFLDSPRISQQNLFIAYWFLLLGAYEETTTPTAPSSQSSCRATSTGCRSLFRCLFYFSFTLIERNWYTWTVMSNKRVYIYIYAISIWNLAQDHIIDQKLDPMGHREDLECKLSSWSQAENHVELAFFFRKG